MLVVVAAGNDFDPCARAGTATYPAAYPETLSVAAATKDGAHAWFSSVGDEVDLAAPGVAVVSDSPGNQVSPADGTSVAAPQVAGAAADVWSGYPSWTASRVRAELLRTAVDLGSAGRDDVFGAGRVQAATGGPAEVLTSPSSVAMTVARTVPCRKPVLVTVRATAPGDIPACGATVSLQTREGLPSARAWRTVARVPAGDDGSAVAELVIGRRSAVRAVVTGPDWLPQATGPEVEVRPMPVLRVTPHRVGGTVVVTTRTAPAARVSLALQRLDPTRQTWVTVARTSSDARGAARFRLRAGRHSTALRVLTTDSPDWAATVSLTVRAMTAG